MPDQTSAPVNAARKLYDSTKDVVRKRRQEAWEKTHRTPYDPDEIEEAAVINGALRSLNVSEVNMGWARIIGLWDMFFRYAAAGEVNSFEEYVDNVLLAPDPDTGALAKADRDKVMKSANIVKYTLAWLFASPFTGDVRTTQPDGTQTTTETTVSVPYVLEQTGIEQKLRVTVLVFRPEAGIPEAKRREMMLEILNGTQESVAEKFKQITSRTQEPGDGEAVSTDDTPALRLPMLTARKKYKANGRVSIVFDDMSVEESAFLETLFGGNLNVIMDETPDDTQG